jgi:hypothetical protein
MTPVRIVAWLDDAFSLGNPDPARFDAKAKV